MPLMSHDPLGAVLDYLRQECAANNVHDLPDAALLERFNVRHEEAAFAALLLRHGPMVLGVCRRVLGAGPDADDAFQATFLVLVRRAAAVRKGAPLAAWLYGVAQRVALKARAKRAARQSRQRELADMARAEPLDDRTWQELWPVLDEEIGRLPQKYQTPLVLCYFHGKTHEEAAQELGCPRRTLTSRLDRGRELLSRRLRKRGLALSAGALLFALTEKLAPAAVGALLTINTAKAAAQIAAGEKAARVLSTQAVTLAEETMKSMMATRAKWLLILLACCLALGAGYYVLAGSGSDEATPPKIAETPPQDIAADGSKKDAFGDPLPAGAVARMGTQRWQHDGSVRFAAFLPDGKRIVTTGDGLTIRIWDFATGKEIGGPKLPLPAPGGKYSTPQAALSKNGKILATYWGGEDIYLHDIDTAKELKRLKIEAKGETPKGGRVFALALSPGGEQLACLQSDGTLQLWDWANGKVVHNFGPPVANLDTDDFSLAYDPDGKSLAAAYLQYAYDKTNKQFDLHTVIKLHDCLTGASKEIMHATYMEWGDDLGLQYVGFSPDGKRLGFFKDRNIVFAEAATGKVIGKLSGHKFYAGCFVFSKDGTKLYADSGKGIGEWDIATGKLLRECGCRRAMSPRLALSPDERTLVLTGGPQTALYRVTPPKAAYEMWAASGGDRSPQFFDLSGKDIKPLNGPTGPVVALQFLPDGQHLLTQRVSGFGTPFALSLPRIDAVQKWDAGSGKHLDTMNLSLGFVRHAGVSPNGKFLAGFRRVSAGDGKPPIQQLVMVDTTSGKEIGQMPLQLTERLPGGGNIAVALSISPDGKTVAVHSFGEGTIKLYAFPGGELRHTLEIVNSKGIGTRNLFTCAFSHDGKMLVSLLSLIEQNAVGLWDVTTGRRVGLIQSPLPGIRTIKGAAFSPDGRCVALALNDGTAAVFELATGQRRSTFGKSQDPPKFPKDGPILIPKDIPCVAISPDGKSLAQVGADRVVRLWDPQTGRELAAWEGHTDAIYALAFAPHGKALASAGEDGTVLVWDLAAVKRPALPARALTPAELNKAWQALAEQDAEKAWPAMIDLVAGAKQSVSFLKDRLKPAAVLDGKRVQELIGQIDDPKTKVRDQAAQELLQLGEQIVPALDKALDAKIPLETRQRLENLRSKLTGLLLHGERLRAYRAVEVLEMIGTPEARAMLQALAEGAPGALLTTSAQAALKRLS
jgi:RNA polymerase sigma factor (sigma-70 family)